MQYPNYLGREGSKCIFTIDKTFYDNHKEKMCQLISLYTLFVFGNKETHIDTPVIVPTKTKMLEMPFKKCLKLLFNDKMQYRIFHAMTPREKKLFYPYKAQLITDYCLDRADLPHIVTRCVKPKKYPCMYDNYRMGIYYGKHFFFVDMSFDPNDSGNELRDDNFLVTKRLGEYDVSIEPDRSEENCEICDNNYIDQNHFLPSFEINNFESDDSETDSETDSENDSEPDSGTVEIVETDSENDSEPDSGTVETGETGNSDNIEISKHVELTLNNLIFDFRTSQFHLTFKGSKMVHVTFDKNSIGGFKHASISTGTYYRVEHPVPSTLTYQGTTYVNSIKITLFPYDDQYFVISEYKAIHVL